MKDLRFIKGDIVFDGTDFEMVSDIDEVGQNLESTLGTNEGEFVLAPEVGIQYRNMVGKGVTEDDIQAEVFAGLDQEERIKTVVEIEVKMDSALRSASVRFKAKLEDGETIEREVDVNVG